MPQLVFARCKSGSRAPVEVTVAPLRNRMGETVGGIEVFRDVSLGVQDLLRAKAIQELTLKCEPGRHARFEVEVCHEACEVVGGDFHRVEQLDDGRLALLVADVMGHGVAAALYTMQLASLWDHHRADLAWPARFIRAMNTHLCLVAGDTGFFATAVLSTYHPASGALRLVRAGHPSPLIFHGHGAVETVGQPQPALGMLPGTVYQESMAQLEPGDDILFFSDGATEVCDAAGNELDVPGLQRLVMDQRAADPQHTFHVAALEEQLLRYSNQIHLPDDLTLLKLRRLA
jgi:sigma-B regulation protein RsbU (phosphoserine phosphatase)